MAEKRRRIEPVPGTDPNAFQFQDASGQPIPPEQLFSGTYSQMLELILLPTITKEQMGALARTGRLARAWIEERQLWRKLFARDYPDAYAYATGNLTSGLTSTVMMDELKDRLDKITAPARRGNERTYWKRYYELMQFRSGGRYSYDKSDSVLPVDRSWLRQIGFQFGTIVALPTPIEHFRNGTIAYVWSPGAGDAAPALRFRMVRLTGAVMDPELIDKTAMDYVLPIYDNDRIWKRSTDGFVDFYWHRTFYALVWRPSINANLHQLLVSSACLTCDAMGVQLYQCGACATDDVGYCGSACQADHWPEHRHTCSHGAK